MRPPSHRLRQLAVAVFAFLSTSAPLTFGVVGGGPVGSGEAPWMAALISEGAELFQGQYCGAVIVHPRWALTAAHCVKGERTGAIEVGTGSRELAGLVRIGVDDIIIHPDFDQRAFGADLALLLLSEPVPPGVTPIPLLADPLLEAPGSMANIAGWGATDATGAPISFPDWLQGANFPIVENGVGNAPHLYDGALTDQMLIAGFAAGGVGLCLGDTGLPLTVGDGHGGRRLAGIASFWAPSDDGCAGPEAYSGFTRISAYRSWIESYTRPDYHVWEASKGVGGAAGDPDADGRTNFAEFAAASDPTVAEFDPELSFRFHAGDGGGIFPAAEMVLRTDTVEIDYGLDFSTDFARWSALDLAGAWQSSAPLPGEPGAELVTFLAPIATEELPGGGAFFRRNLRQAAVVTRVGRSISAPGYAYSSLSAVDLEDGAGALYKDFVLAGDVGGSEWEALARSPEFDVFLQLLDGATEEVISSSAGGSAGGADEQLTFVGEPGRNYTLRVRSSVSGGAGAFSLAVVAPPPSFPHAPAGSTDGALDKGDPLDPGGLPLEFYLDEYEIVPADHERLVFVFLRSVQGEEAFDPFVHITNAETGIRVAENDDIAFADPTAFVAFTAEPRVSYTLGATSFLPGATGSYRISLFPLRELVPGQPQAGHLEPGDASGVTGSFYDGYFLPKPPAGTTVTVTVQSSEVDPFLIHFDSGYNEIRQDDNSGEGNAAQITFVADGEDSYVFDASSAQAAETGSYVIEVTLDGID